MAIFRAVWAAVVMDARRLKPGIEWLMDYLKAHWRGELPLGVSFWINGVALNVAKYISMLLLQPAIDRLAFDRAMIVTVALTTVEIVITIWQFVGIWRSATKSADSTRNIVWPTLAKLSVILGALRTVVALVTFAQQVGTVAEIVNDPALQAYEVETRDGINVLLHGTITDDSVDEVLAGLTEPNMELLQVNSPGGFMVPAIRLGRHIRQSGVPVLADGQCLSACVFLLAASPDAAITAGTKVTLHRVDHPRESADPEFRNVAREAQRQADAFLYEMGVSPWAILVASQRESWTPTIDQLVEMGLIDWVYLASITQFVPADEYCRQNVVECSSE